MGHGRRKGGHKSASNHECCLQAEEAQRLSDAAARARRLADGGAEGTEEEGGAGPSSGPGSSQWHLCGLDSCGYPRRLSGSTRILG